MKTKLFLLIAGVFAALLSSCNDGNNRGESGATKSPYFVQVYYAANDFELRQFKDGDKYILSIVFKGEKILCSYPPKTKFKKLAEYFNDGSYKGLVVPFINRALAESLSSVSVVCDKDFDAGHPAGQPLDDIVSFCATSPYEFIQRGYKDSKKAYEYPNYWRVMDNGGWGYEPIEMQINAVNQGNTPMLSPLCYLYFKRNPAGSGEYTFTVSIKIGDTEMAKAIKATF